MSTQAEYINQYLWSLKGGGGGGGGRGRGEEGEGNNLAAAYIGPTHLEHSKKRYNTKFWRLLVSRDEKLLSRNFSRIYGNANFGKK